MIPVIASNRIGTEHATQDSSYELTFYGHSFITDHTGALMCAADEHSETVLVHEFDMEAIRDYRNAWVSIVIAGRIFTKPSALLTVLRDLRERKRILMPAQLYRHFVYRLLGHLSERNNANRIQ